MAPKIATWSPVDSVDNADILCMFNTGQDQGLVNSSGIISVTVFIKWETFDKLHKIQKTTSGAKSKTIFKHFNFDTL